ncbi:MAG: hypothetical protein LAT53_05795 [Idiomarina sp.]|nr:hypothetical protein [Idiomarina sp.]
MQVLYSRNVQTVQCNRCELRYPKKESECPHCKDLSDSEVKTLKLETEREADAHSDVGKVMLGAAIIMMLVVALLFVLL